MGRATRWLKSLFGIKREKGQKEINPNSGSQRENKWTGMGHSGRDTADGLCSNPNTIPPNITPAEAAWLRSFYADSGDKEQSKHAIAVAAATAAAADAAVAAAQAAVAVVRLTSQGRGGTMFGGGGGGGCSREKWAVTKIQSVFRGFLARKALRALKGLVKLQALVRGYLVRKQAFATFHSMQALIRAQANVRAQKTRGLLDSTAASSNRQFHAANSAEKFDEGRSRQNSFHNRRLSASFDSINSNAIDEIPKIVEIDTGRPKSRSRRSSAWVSDSISGDAQTLSSSCQCRHPPPHLSIPDCRNSQDSDWGLTGDECRFSTPQSTPRFSNSCGTNPPVTPAKSVCVESLFRNCPNYMANTQSFKAKLRSYSAPKQRPEPGSKRRLSLNEMMESRSSLSGVRMQRSCSQVQEVLSFRNAVAGRLGRSSEFSKEQLYNRDSCSQEYFE